VDRFPTLELVTYPRRAVVMAAAAGLALSVDFMSKTVAVAVWPPSLLFNISTHTPFGMGERLIVVLAACSLLACVLPSRVVGIGAGLALGGAIGNLVSRYAWSGLGGSPDFIPFGDGSTGNVADLCIVLGGLAMLLGTALWLASTLSLARRESRPGT
jgi:hypothetical protein